MLDCVLVYIRFCYGKFIKTSRYTASWPLRHAALPENYRLQIITKEAFLLMKYVCAEWAIDHFGLGLT